MKIVRRHSISRKTQRTTRGTTSLRLLSCWLLRGPAGLTNPVGIGWSRWTAVGKQSTSICSPPPHQSCDWPRHRRNWQWTPVSDRWVEFFILFCRHARVLLNYPSVGWQSYPPLRTYWQHRDEALNPSSARLIGIFGCIWQCPCQEQELSGAFPASVVWKTIFAVQCQNDA